MHVLILVMDFFYSKPSRLAAQQHSYSRKQMYPQGKWWEHFCRSLDPTHPCCFNLKQICRRKRLRAQEIKFLQISFFITFPFITPFLMFFLCLYLQHMPTHTHTSRIAIPLFSLLPFTAWGANECRGDHWRGNGGSPQLWFPLWFIKFAIVSKGVVQSSSLGKLWQHRYWKCDRYMRREQEVRQIQRKRQSVGEDNGSCVRKDKGFRYERRTAERERDRAREEEMGRQ